MFSFLFESQLIPRLNLCSPAFICLNPAHGPLKRHTQAPSLHLALLLPSSPILNSQPTNTTLDFLQLQPLPYLPLIRCLALCNPTQASC